MNPIAVEAIGSIIRWVLAILAGYLVKHQIWTASQATSYVAAAALGLISVGWSFYQKYGARLKLLVALKLPAGSTEASVEQKISGAKASGLPLPSVATPKNLVPTVILLLLVGAGANTMACAKQPVITNVPAGVNAASVQAWGVAVDNFHIIETARHNADSVLRPLVLNKTLPVSVLQIMVKVDEDTLAGLNLLEQSPNTFDQPMAAQITALAVNILAQIASLNAPALPPAAVQPLAAINTSARKIQSLKGTP